MVPNPADDPPASPPPPFAGGNFESQIQVPFFFWYDRPTDQEGLSGQVGFKPPALCHRRISAARPDPESLIAIVRPCLCDGPNRRLPREQRPTVPKRSL